ncbi:DUF1127 domain-containing protein [Nitratireductor kimnyeongensis]|uniref:DUF1127 domain-containing protein n=1 Tax=Nitratireductor kimnyeongensis TaxID=430679 RepID=A0ABW0T2U1_9HYPH|nr:DUF1127 domain-containing protein [Nitratireductor kimnyeongensis]QZZ35296.1 DUF1127 domain-containing protein [Nitratireductor kimnyeongensis]
MEAIKTAAEGCKLRRSGFAETVNDPGLHSTLDRLRTLLGKRRSRLALLDLTNDQLRDIGVSREEARREGLRSFWD